MRGNTCYVAATLNIYTPRLHRAARFVRLPREKTSPSFIHVFLSSCFFLAYRFPKKLLFKNSKKESYMIYLYNSTPLTRP